MPSPLEMFLRAYHGTGGTLTPEMYAHFGGDDILSQLKKYDPGAHWTDVEMGGGEGGSYGTGKRLDFDVTKLPTSKMGNAALDLRPSNFGDLIRPGMVTNDDVYGSVTNSRNIRKPKDPLWTKLAPLAVSMLAPMAGAALAGAGIGGAAGLTSSVTGSGLSGLNSLNLPKWGIDALSKLPNTAQSIEKGGFNPMSFVPMLGNVMGLPNVPGGNTLAKLALSFMLRR